MELLCAYHWPGNVRELDHTIERAVTLTMNSALLPGDLPPRLQQQTHVPRLAPPHHCLPSKSWRSSISRRSYVPPKAIKNAPPKSSGSIAAVLYRMAKRYGLDFDHAHVDEPD